VPDHNMMSGRPLTLPMKPADFRVSQSRLSQQFP
jgi:hypothetical protein